MLVISRKERGEVYFRHRLTNQIIRVDVLEIRGGKVRIGIEAAQEWQVLRSEVIDEKLSPEEQEIYARSRPSR